MSDTISNQYKIIKMKNLLHYLNIIGITLLLGCNQQNEKNFNSKSIIISKIDSLVSTTHDNGHFQGSILISIGDSIVYSRGFGKANENKKNQPHTKFKIASLTKSVTAALILKLHERGKLDINKSISKYVDSYEDSLGDKILIRHLLTHSSGIPNYTMLPEINELHTKSVTTEELINFFKDQPLNFEPGTKFEYTNSGYALLGYIAEKVTGKDYAKLLDELIFIPLGMENSSYFNQSEFTTLSYKPNGEVISSQGIDMSVPYAAGAIQSTVKDMFIFQKSLFNNSLLKDSQQRLIFRKGVGDYGLGWFIMEAPSFTDPNESLMIAEHGGSIPGFTSQMTKILNDDIFIISLNNIDGAQLFPLHIKIAELIYLEDSSPNNKMELIQVQ